MLGNNDYGWTPGKAATISLKDKICPDCLRLKATNAREAGVSCYCPKWYAVNDDDAKNDCEQLWKKKAAAGITRRPSENEALNAALDETLKERDELKRLLSEKNETANTFMEQVKSLQSELCKISGALNAADGDDLVQIVKDVCAQKQSLANQNADLLAKTSLAGYRAMGEQVATALDERDEARKNYALAHSNLGKEVVENGKLRAALTEIVEVKNIPRDDFDGCPSVYDESCYRRKVAADALNAEASNKPS